MVDIELTKAIQIGLQRELGYTIDVERIGAVKIS